MIHIERAGPHPSTILAPWANLLLLGIAACGLVWMGLAHVSAVHAARQARLEACRARLEAHISRQRLGRAGYAVLPTDACLALDLVERR